jgi:hypothetical protein
MYLVPNFNAFKKKKKEEFRDLPTHVKHLLVVFGKLTFC